MKSKSRQQRFPGRVAVFCLLASLPIAGVFVWALLSPGSNERVEEENHPPERPARELDPDVRERLIQANAQRSAGTKPGEKASTLRLLSEIREELVLEDAFLERMERIATPSWRNFQDRHRVVRGLGNDLSDAELEALYRFLLSPPPDGERERVHDRVIKNDVMNRLRNQSEAPAGLTDVLTAMFDDLEQDGAVRDYALQHLRAWHSSAPLEDRPLIISTLSRGLDEAQGSVPGTALLSLHYLNETGETDELGEIPSVAVEMAHREEVDDLSRITAVQVAAERDPQEVFDLAVRWALDASSSYPRRISAIAALGSTGLPAAADVLAEVALLEDERLEPALRSAFDRIRRAEDDSNPLMLR